MNEGRKIEVLKPFGPTIAKTNIPEDIVNKLNEYVEELIKDDLYGIPLSFFAFSPD